MKTDLDMFMFSVMISDSLRLKSWYVKWNDGTSEQSTLSIVCSEQSKFGISQIKWHLMLKNMENNWRFE